MSPHRAWGTGSDSNLSGIMVGTVGPALVCIEIHDEMILSYLDCFSSHPKTSPLQKKKYWG